MLPALLNQRVAKIIPDTTQIDPAYLFHLLNEDRFEQEACRSATGAAQQNLSTGWVETYEIPLPPLEEQRRIVAEIEGYQNEIARLESEIAANRERIQTTIDAVWNGDSESANGAPPSQPGATPQVKGRKQNEG